jgi:hypothetical protein
MEISVVTNALKIVDKSGPSRIRTYDQAIMRSRVQAYTESNRHILLHLKQKIGYLEFKVSDNYS